MVFESKDKEMTFEFVILFIGESWNFRFVNWMFIPQKSARSPSFAAQGKIGRQKFENWVEKQNYHLAVIHLELQREE